MRYNQRQLHLHGPGGKYMFVMCNLNYMDRRCVRPLRVMAYLDGLVCS